MSVRSESHILRGADIEKFLKKYNTNDENGSFRPHKDNRFKIVGIEVVPERKTDYLTDWYAVVDDMDATTKGIADDLEMKQYDDCVKAMKKQRKNIKLCDSLKRGGKTKKAKKAKKTRKN